MFVPEVWILHSKTLARQRTQDAFYRSLGQHRGMARPEPAEGTVPEVGRD